MRTEIPSSGLHTYLDHGVIKESIKFLYPTDSLGILQQAGLEHEVQINVLATGGNEYTTSGGQHAIVPLSQTLIEISHQKPSLSDFWIRVSELAKTRK